MSETSGDTLRRWLLQAVHQLDDAAPRRQVHTEVERAFGKNFSTEDRLPRRGRPGGEEAWRNNIDSLYDRLKHSGVMEPSRLGDPWRLSARGVLEAASYGQSPTDESHLLHGFKPKDSSSYVVEIAARTQTKAREHEALVALFGHAVAREGWSPVTVGVHPVDLVLHKREHLYLVEVKVVYQGHTSHAVREALAQLLEYRHFLYADNLTPPRLLALFSESIGAANCAFLETLGIDSVWLQGDGWCGTAAAASAGLASGAIQGSA